MALHRFDVASLEPMPWKNGGGSTREIASWPAAAGIDGFDWRVSVATIDRPGPFSVFEGVDRIIMLLDGAGLRLHSGAAQFEHRLDRLHEPFAFAGELAPDCELLGQRSTDFNLMTRRGRVRADLRVLKTEAAIADAEAGLLLALRGRWQLRAEESQLLEPGSGLWWEREVHGWQAASPEVDALLIALRIDTDPNPSGRTP